MSAAAFENAVKSAVTGVWTGAMLPAQGTAALIAAVQTYLNEAWYAGAEVCGIREGELTPVEESEKLNFITTQQAFAGRLMSDVYQNREALPETRLEPFLSRANLWVQRYHHAYQTGKQMACADRKMIWELGATEEHCADCSRVAGRVHRASIWQKYGWQPGSKALACRGFNCDCRLVLTDKPAMPGHPPFVRGS